ncbi:ABC transporter permease [Sediminispirochaeta bajacaliforniensis]|uniref:ABC transporter permease n=1 Tax=Sediminispirochaeta bajacaliforniensis TaxID=148 RepID=UPI000382162B|nr:ABC transporter permease [Sediminispirochaeta bajacaliforniensis]
MNWESIFNVSLLYATFRSATPIIYAALCAALTQQADILNIGTEGIMLTGAFAAVAVSYLSGSWFLGVLMAMFAGLLMALIMAVAHLKYKADICAIGMGINMFALAITKFLLNSVLGKRGTFSDPLIVPIPRVKIPLLEGSGILNSIFNNWAITEWFVIFLIAFMSFVFYKTKWGLHLRAVGQSALAAQSAGINVTAMKYNAIAISGVIGGLAGAHLSLGYSNLFTENMTNSRGFMGVAAMFFGGADPLLTSVGCLVFGFADSIGCRLQSFGIPAQIVLLMPYVVTIVVLSISMISKHYAEMQRKSSLIGG